MDLENFPTRETAKDMLSMISPIYDRSYVGKWIFQVMAASMELARETVEDMKNQAFPETATWSLPWWEERYGITGNEGKSLEERRRPIVQKRNTKRPMNPHRIAALVAEISGREVEIYENVAPHTYEVIIRPGSSNVDLAAVAEEIYKVKQSQKHVRIVFETPVRLQVRPAGMNFSFRHIIAGTRPDVNRPGALQPLEVDVAPQATGQAFTYQTPGEEKRAGSYPDVSTIGEMTAPGVNARITGESAGIVYKICGATRL